SVPSPGPHQPGRGAGQHPGPFHLFTRIAPRLPTGTRRPREDAPAQPAEPRNLRETGFTESLAPLRVGQGERFRILRTVASGRPLLDARGAVMRTARIGRNAPSPCGSGKKSKKCCQNRAVVGRASGQDGACLLCGLDDPSRISVLAGNKATSPAAAHAPPK